MTDEKELLGDSMDMFSHGNDTINRAPAHEAVPDPAREEAAPAQVDADRARDEQGRFASKEVAKPDATPAATIPPVVADVDPEKQPISRAEFKGMLEWRDKAQKAEARAAELERRFQENQPKQSQIPSIQNDPDAIAQYVQSARDDAVFTFSEKIARKEHGEEAVTSAMEWGLQRARQNPAFQAEYLRQEHPIDWVVKQQKRDEILNQIGDDPDAFIEKRIAARLAALGQGGAAPSQPQAAQPSPAASPQPASQQTQTPAPTRSIANATSAGGVQVVPPSGEFAAIDGMFNR